MKHCTVYQFILFLSTDKPGSPEDLKVSDVYADHCTLSWKHPTDDGGADINGEYFSIYVCHSS